MSSELWRCRGAARKRGSGAVSGKKKKYRREFSSRGRAAPRDHIREQKKDEEGRGVPALLQLSPASDLSLASVTTTGTTRHQRHQRHGLLRAEDVNGTCLGLRPPEKGTGICC